MNKKINIKTFKAAADYPVNFSSFKDGVDIKDNEINKWIKECLDDAEKDIKENPGLKKTFGTISSGNTKVFVEVYIQDDNLYTVYVNVTKDYSEYSECYVDFPK